MDIEKQILETAKEIDTLKAKGAGTGGIAAIVAEMPMAGKLPAEKLMEVLDGIPALAGKSPEEVAKVISEDDTAREALMRALAAAIDKSSAEVEDSAAVTKMKAESTETGEMPDGP